MLLPNRNESGDEYRYGFQGQEIDEDIKGEGNSVNYKYRMHDPRVGRFFAVDPLTAKYPHYTPYSFSGNEVINKVELEGLEPADPGTTIGEKRYAEQLSSGKVYEYTWTESSDISGKSEWVRGEQYLGISAREARDLAEHVYELDKDGVNPGVIISGWELDREIDDISMSGFKGGVYKKTVGGVEFYAAVFAGTDDLMDAAADAEQAVGSDNYQYRKAAYYSKKIIEEYGTNVTFVGHSLGGGMASLASLITNQRGITFNAAGLSTMTLLRNGIVSTEDTKITAYVVKGEVLNSTLKPFGQGAVGNIIMLEPMTPYPDLREYLMDITTFGEQIEATEEYRADRLGMVLANHSISRVKL